MRMSPPEDLSLYLFIAAIRPSPPHNAARNVPSRFASWAAQSRRRAQAVTSLVTRSRACQAPAD